MGKKRIVLDTNIIISAFGWDGKPREILREILNKEFDLIISKKQLEEIFKVLGYPKFKFTDSQKSKFINIYRTYASKTKLHVPSAGVEQPEGTS